MILYNVWFSFKAGSDEAVEIEKIKMFLNDLQDRAMIHEYRLLKNRAQAGKSKLPPYQMIAEFSDENQFGLPFAEVKRIGIHSGRHGSMIENVDEFVVELFEDL